MPYRYLEPVQIEEVAFEVWGRSKEELFLAASDALMNVMVDELETIGAVHRRSVILLSESLEGLLCDLLREIIFFKEAEELLLRVLTVQIKRFERHWVLSGVGYGDRISPGKHFIRTEIKRLNQEQLRIEETAGGWTATVEADI